MTGATVAVAATGDVVDSDAVLDDLRRLVEVESPSEDLDAVRRSGEAVAELLDRRLGGTGEVGDDGRVTWANDGSDAGGTARPLLLLGHHDTVWPLGTLARKPFEVANGRITGPGVFDMKAGLVVAVHALMSLRAAGSLPSVRWLVTSDEEIAAPRSRPQIEEEARRCRRVLVLEPCGRDGAVKTARKGIALGLLTAHGRASHSGLAPEEGRNAATALGSVLAEVEALSDLSVGTTVVPTRLRAGTAINTVPARAEADLDVRFLDPVEVERVRRGLASLVAPDGVRFEVDLPVNRGALTEAASAPLLPALRTAAAEAGQAIGTVAVGGVSDGNIAAEVGAAVLDGLGPEGDGAHAEHEHVTLHGLDRRVALLRRLVPHAAIVEVP